MSATAAAARYVIVADDKTKAAIASVNAGFKSMERGAKSSARGINTALALVGAAGIAGTFRKVFTETAKHSKEFASALDDVKRSATGLLAAKDGAPAATAALRELAEVLKDPEVVTTADAVASGVIRIAAGTVKFAAGVKTLNEKLEELQRRRDALLAGEGNSRRSFIKGEPTFNPNAAQEIFGINAEIEQTQRQIRERDAANAQAQIAFWDRVNSAADQASNRFETMREFAQNIKDLEAIEKSLRDGAAGDREFFEQLAREGDVARTLSRGKFFEAMEEAANNVRDTLTDTERSINEVGDAIGDTIGATAEWSAATDQAARNIQDAFADFLFDPFKDGLRGMLLSFVNTIRRMAAEVAAAQIFDKAGGVAGVSGFLGGLFGGKSTSAGLGAYLDQFSVPKYASGTSYVPRDQLAFVHKGEAIIPAHLNGRTGVTFAPVTNIDARGSTPDALKLLPEILKRNNEKLKAEIVGGLRSGRL